MFFPEKITGIKDGDRVLEVGPGGTPHPRSDVFLERRYDSEEEWEAQRGMAPRLDSDKRTVYYDGGRFPFDDHEFDYVICSHVIEHLDDVPAFLSEMFRVAPRGYLEYPTICYEYLYNFDVHVNFVKFRSGVLFYLPKKETHLDEFMPVQKLLQHSLAMGYSRTVDDLKHVMFEGFEWTARFEARRATSLADLVGSASEITKAPEEYRYGIFSYVARKMKNLAKRVFFARK